MKTDKPSRTSEGTTAVRAREMRRPAGERICHDHFAPHFLTLREYPLLGKAFGWLYEKRCPGLRGGILARTRYIDERMTMCLGDGVGQLVILGAGYDSRAYRLAAPPADVTVFEVDHPATQAVKVAKLRKLFDPLPEHVVFVPVDFCTDDLADRLAASGYDRTKKTLFIWEGVTYYIPAAAVDSTLAFVANNSTPGSSIVFDCFPRSVADGSSTLREARSMHRFLKRHGEPLLFGLDPEEIEPFLRTRGFERVEIMSPTACKQAWFHNVNATIPISEMFRFVHATHFCGKGGEHG